MLGSSDMSAFSAKLRILAIHHRAPSSSPRQSRYPYTIVRNLQGMYDLPG
jgi:hypothetical protein